MIEKNQKAFKNKELPKALQKKSKKKKLIIIFFIIIWCIIIFIFSNMSGNESNIKSKETINNVIDKTLEVTNNSGITDKHPSENKMNNVINKLNKPLRKCMHAGVFFILAILIYLGLKSFEVRGIKLSIIPIVICFLYACSDEYHQTFVKGRTSQFTDVLIDTVGAIIGIIIINIIVKIVYKIKERKRKKVSVLYIETATYLKKDLEWTWYTYDEERVKVWEKYISSYGDLTLIAPYEKEVCNKKTKGLIKLGNIYGLEKKHITLEYVDDLYENKFNMLNRKLKEEISNLIARKIKYKGFEVIVIGKDKNFYQRQAIKYAKKFKKQYEIN